LLLWENATSLTIAASKELKHVHLSKSSKRSREIRSEELPSGGPNGLAVDEFQPISTEWQTYAHGAGKIGKIGVEQAVHTQAAAQVVRSEIEKDMLPDFGR
jgi:hypothetical protein